jgi:hypothetical protein
VSEFTHGRKIRLAPASEPHISIYGLCEPALDFPSPGWGTFYKHQIFEPGAPQSENACGFLRRHFEMIVEITTVLFLIQGISALSRVIGRRGDVLYYVSEPEPRR